MAKTNELDHAADDVKPAITTSKVGSLPRQRASLRKGPLFPCIGSPVTSVDITQIGYQENSETLEIQFSRGEVCQYYNVPCDIYDELVKSPAKEEYYHTRIGERFPCTRIR